MEKEKQQEDQDNKKTEASPLSEEQVQLEKCAKERDEYLEGWKRAKADFINYKKEETERLEMFVKFSNAGLLRELLTVLDSFEFGLKNLGENDSAREGMSSIKNQFENILKHVGVTQIVVSKGDTFNPAFHEAISEIVLESPSGTVAKEIQRGYFLYEKVLRPTRVVVSKEAEKQTTGNGEQITDK